MFTDTLDYSRLRGRIVEKCGSNQAFSNAMGWAQKTNTAKLTGRASWTQADILKACKILDIALQDIQGYFFTPKC